MKSVVQLVLWYLKQNAIAFDQVGNTLLGGWADETLSSRAYRADVDGKLLGKVFRPLIDFVFFFEDDHCRKSYLSEVRKNQHSRKIHSPHYQEEL
jgi:hypothetical protein